MRGVYAVCIELLIERDRWVMQAVIEKVKLDIERSYPNGIPSAVVDEND